MCSFANNESKKEIAEREKPDISFTVHMDSFFIANMEKGASGHVVPANGAFLFPFSILQQLSFFCCVNILYCCSNIRLRPWSQCSHWKVREVRLFAGRWFCHLANAWGYIRYSSLKKYYKICILSAVFKKLAETPVSKRDILRLKERNF